MILEHEIPNGSKLYFGKSAKAKRDIENIASDILDANGFEEIVTPLFSYHQHLSIADEKKLIKVNDAKNNSISIRADSTIDVVRIIEKRLGRNTQHRKWFYIQPVFTYPTTEQNQIGAEFMGEKKLSSVMNIANEILSKLDVKPLVQISNIKIPKILVGMFDELTLDDFRHINIEKFLNLKVEWFEKLIYLQYVEQIDELLEIVPESIKIELLKMKELSVETAYDNTVLAPMYYAKMLYYDELYFRVIDKNEVYARGGRYKNEDLTSVGFAIYTDALCETLTK
ncbi:ATP phosphoribosyltransferase regulatory subunit [Sulfurimonas gotlandica GD1]|jgi:histidyl-tRNA synthetase|uniref:ATP phosphoribosyltransferase regulatory subunit n=1 Tax=Sulfurimonas gotlandica (strain DSM 19862 / JCM 16533 / GD1) TaxID=929558 RepID=B6BHN3_SULGG|nr:ATP phosphoribosyltransferase regulatory subunit [Sulfurimonas gotlandica]EDZ63424.1 tRNA synthetase, class II [Sulfurimonas gotlandica GD1]EHP30031.1 ATP phosphoribosyltransferase regulatory subunit [Sulfurimonas gotlandica GD1]